MVKVENGYLVFKSALTFIQVPNSVVVNCWVSVCWHKDDLYFIGLCPVPNVLSLHYDYSIQSGLFFSFSHYGNYNLYQNLKKIFRQTFEKWIFLFRFKWYKFIKRVEKRYTWKSSNEKCTNEKVQTRKRTNDNMYKQQL